MIYTNKHKLPGVLARALQSNDHKQEGKYSVSGLLNPPRQQQLFSRHNQVGAAKADTPKTDLIKDVSENLWALLGTAVHGVIQRFGKANDLIEQHICVEIDGISVSGTPDHFNLETLELNDWKVTSVYSYQKGGRAEWEQQLNLYAWMIGNKFGKYPKRLSNRLVLRDHQASKAKYDVMYPSVPFVTINQPLWAPEQAEALFMERIRLHEEAAKLPDDKLPLCTAEERWQRPDAWKAQKAGAKRATKVFTGATGLVDANKFAEEKHLEVKYMRGGSIRCADYCAVNGLCSQYKEEVNAT